MRWLCNDCGPKHGEPTLTSPSFGWKCGVCDDCHRTAVLVIDATYYGVQPPPPDPAQ